MNIVLVSPETYSEEMRKKWGEEYRGFCRTVWGDVYPNEELGITAEMIDVEFEQEGLWMYFDELFADDRIAWLALDSDGQILGGVSIQPEGSIVKMQGLYVAGRGQGVGGKLFDTVIEYAAGRRIEFEVPYYFEAVGFYTKKGCCPTGDDLVSYPWVNPIMVKNVRGMKMRYQA